MKPASPATGLLYAALAFALFITCWKAYTILLGAIGLLVLARRGWDWCRSRPDSVWTAALAGAPFFLLLAVAGLVR